MKAHRVEAGTLELGGGLETLVRAALENVPVDGELEILTASRGVAYELPAWARIAGHQHVGDDVEGHGGSRRFVVRIRRGATSRLLADALPPRGDPLPARNGVLHIAELRQVEPVPAAADPHAGLVALGALAEAGTPQYAWRLNERDRIWADELASLTERAAKAQWDATLDIPWNAAAGLPTHIEQAVAQVMTYIAQNEYAALYVPARFLPQVNPRYSEVLLWLASHVHDEARHVEVFTKRALAGGARAHALASTDLSLHSLLEGERLLRRGATAERTRRGHFPRPAPLRRASRPRRRDRGSRTPRAPRRETPRSVRNRPRTPPARGRTGAAERARQRRRSPRSKAHDPLRPEPPGNRVADTNRRSLAPARRAFRSRQGTATTAADDGAEPHTTPTCRRLRRANRPLPIRPTHPEPHVAAPPPQRLPPTTPAPL